MELCTGSSLYEVIDSPDNAYGLSEMEFKQVIYDVGKVLPSPWLCCECNASFNRKMIKISNKSTCMCRVLFYEQLVNT